jgi:hypothetical protein
VVFKWWLRHAADGGICWLLSLLNDARNRGDQLVNVVSSGVATVIFAWRGAIDWRLGALLGAVMYLGAYTGARLTPRYSEVWLRRFFVLVVLMLAIKTLATDVPWTRLFDRILL